MSDFASYPALRIRTVCLSDTDRSAMTPEQLAEQHKKDRATYRRMRERMAADPEYREARLLVARRGTKKWQEKNRGNPEVVARRREKDRRRRQQKGHEIAARSRELYTGDRAEKIRARNRDWYSRNRERRKAYNKAYRQAHGEELRAKNRERNRAEYAVDPKRVNDYNREWRAKNPQKARQYIRVSNIKRRAATRDAHFTTTEWLELLARVDGRCGYASEECQGPVEADHRVPLCRGGSNTIDNIIPACRHHNRRKNKMTEDEFRALLDREERARATASATVSPAGPDEAAPARR